MVEERETTHDEAKTVMKPLDEHPAVRSALPLSYGFLLATLAISVLVATVLMGIRATSWSGASFPGFFVLPNRVVASIGEPHWTASKDGSLYQRTVVAVDGAPVDSSAEVYQRIGQRPSGTTFAVTLQQGSTTDTVSLRSMEFSWGDYSAIFGAYLATGVLYLMMGLLGAWLLPGTHLGRALLFVGSTGGVYTLSAIGIYEPYGGFRIHALAEAFFPAGVVYLGLVFPRERGALVKPGAAVAYWVSLGLAIPYQLLLDQPGAYSVMHAASETYLGLASLGLTVSLVVHYASAADDDKPFLRSATAGVLLGLAVPAVVMTLSGLSGGRLPVNICTVTAFLFPLCFGYGIVRECLAGEPTLREIASERAAPF